MKIVCKVYYRAFKERAIQLSYEKKHVSELTGVVERTSLQLHKWHKEL